MSTVDKDKNTQEKQRLIGDDVTLSKKGKYSIIIGICVAAAIILVLVGVYLSLGVVNPLYVVVSESMFSTLNVGDIVVINRNAPFDSLNVGDIIVFTTPGETTKGTHKTVVHRISGIETYGDFGTTTITTKGDANPRPIELMDYPIKEQNYIGKVVFTIPKIGLLSVWLR